MAPKRPVARYRQNAPGLAARRIPALAGLIVLLYAWQRASARLSPLVLPGPAVTWQRLCRLFGSGALAAQLSISLQRALAGFALAYVVALLAGVLMHRFRWVRYTLAPWLDAVQIVPTVVWLIFAVLWFGIARDATPIFVVFVVCLPVVLVQLREGLAAVPAELQDLAALEPMGLWSYTRHVMWPAARPAFIAAATLGFSFAWRAVVIAEFVASNSGLGYQLSRAYYNLATDEVFAWTLVLVVLMWLWQALVISPWRRRGLVAAGAGPANGDAILEGHVTTRRVEL